MNIPSDKDFERQSQKYSQSSCKMDDCKHSKKPKMQKDWGEPEFLNSNDQFEMVKDSLSNFDNVQHINAKCDVCSITPFFTT